MWAWLLTGTELLWHSAVAVIPLALIVWAVCRWARCRPATRHTLWLCLLIWLVAGVVLPPIPIPTWQTTPVTSAADGAEHGETTPDAAAGAAGARPSILAAGRAEPPDSGAEPVRPSIDIASTDDASHPRRISRSPGRAAGEVAPARSLSRGHRGGRAQAEDVPTPPWTVVPAGPLRSHGPGATSGSAGRLSTDQLAAGAAQSGQSPPRPAARWPGVAVGQGLGRAAVRRDAAEPLGRLVAGDRPSTRFAEVGPRPHLPEASRRETAAGAGATAIDPDTQGISDVGFSSDFPTAPRERTLPAPLATLVPLLSDHLGRWVSRLAAVRDAVGTLPPFPPVLWVGGIVIAAAVRARQISRFRRRIQAGAPAPASVVGLVADAAKTYALRRVPETILVRDRISPMIWCGRRTILVLPRALWLELDVPGRRAVVYHELAHLCRRDHWVCWIESVIGAIYWWHPAVWWVRGRLREEAENCCDAWVTWLLPRGRRAYAEALLAARQFVSRPVPAVPRLGIGVTSGRAKRFAGRITMVMTERTMPRTSIAGIALALSVVAAGWVATPARSSEQDQNTKLEKGEVLVVKPEAAPCPPKASKPAKPVRTTAGGRLADEVLIVVPPPGPTAAPLVAPAGSRRGIVSFATPAAPAASVVVPTASNVLRFGPPERRPHGVAVAPIPASPHRADPVGIVWSGDRHGGPPRATGEVGPQKNLEARLARLEDQIARLSNQLDRLSGAAGPNRRGLENYVNALTAMQRHAAPDKVESAAEAYGAAIAGRPSAESALRAYRAMRGPLDDGRVIAKSYKLPEGKLEALTELMIRSDVPIRVAPHDDWLEVHATASQHATFEAFVDMIHPSKKGERRTSLDLRSRGRDILGGTGIGQTEIATLGVAEALLASRAAQAARSQAGAKAQARMRKAEALIAMNQAELANRRAEMDRVRVLAAELEAQGDRIESEAEHLDEEADRLRDKSEEVREKAADADDREQAARLRDRAKALEAQARELERQARALARQAEQVERQAEEMEERAEEAEERIEELTEEGEELIEEMEEIAEETEVEEEPAERPRR